MSKTSTMTNEERLAFQADALPVSIRAHNVIRAMKFETVGDLVKTEAKSFFDIRNCGKNTVAEIIACLKMMGLKLENSDGMFTDTVIDDHIASISKYLAEIREEKQKPKVETFHEKRAKEIQQRQIQVMQMRATGATFRSIGKEIGRSGHTARVYFSRLGRKLAWEANKRMVPLSEVLMENNIPVSVIPFMKQDGITITGM